MSAKTLVGGILAALVLCACAMTAGDAARPRAQIERDKFSSVITVVGPTDSVNPYGGTFREWFLRSRVNKRTRVAATQLYVDISYVGSWRWYGAATDDTTTALAVDKLGSQVGTCFGAGVCSREEIVGVELDGGKLRSHAQEGYAIKLSARNGDGFTVVISPAQAQAQLAALARLKALPPPTP